MHLLRDTSVGSHTMAAVQVFRAGALLQAARVVLEPRDALGVIHGHHDCLLGRLTGLGGLVDTFRSA